MRKKIPSTAALLAFEAAARHESFTRAAEELALTQSAICRQIAGLEAFLGIELFRRSRRGVKLTEAGLVTREQRGRWAHYTVVRNVLDVARDFLGESTEGPRCC